MSRWIIKEITNFFRCDGQTAVEAAADFCEVPPNRIRENQPWPSPFPEGRGENKTILEIRKMLDDGVDITLVNPEDPKDMEFISVLPDNRKTIWDEREQKTKDAKSKYLITKSTFVNGTRHHIGQYVEEAKTCLKALSQYLGCEKQYLIDSKKGNFHTTDSTFTCYLENSYRISASRHIIVLKSDYVDTSLLYYVEKIRSVE